eukprot:TRINITY_DN3298_c0_g1_i1.p1 TRINITY_DN3298_c0_g1~~TRINITY_DN3298_c0_g1_i1.p1  ORF type:complete len:401 (-),score=93.72 TRINITY_DN3298_c0_g1_i1:27-1133(-)
MENDTASSLILDRDLNIGFVDESVLSTIGFTKEELISKSFTEIFRPENEKDDIAMTLRNLLENDGSEDNIVVLSKGGKPLNFLLESKIDGLEITLKEETKMIDKYDLLRENDKFSLIILKGTKKVFSLKYLEKKSLSAADVIKARLQLQAWKDNPHPNICKLEDFDEESDRFIIVEEYIPGEKKLTTYVNTNGPFSELETKRLAIQLFDVLEFAKSIGLSHSVELLKHILLDSNKNIKVINFGPKSLDSSFTNVSFCGDPITPPELLMGDQAVPGAEDMWSLGIVVFFMLTKDFPFHKISDALAIRYKIPDSISIECGKAIESMLNKEDKRIKSEQWKEMEWIRNDENLLKPDKDEESPEQKSKKRRL